MQNDCTNIYQSARKIAGLTQERAAELLGLSQRSLADYEAGLRLPPSDVADLMVLVYNSQILAVQHLQECTRFARDCCPTSGPWPCLRQSSRWWKPSMIFPPMAWIMSSFASPGTAWSPPMNVSVKNVSGLK